MHKFIECTDFTVSSQLGYAHMQYNVICYIVSSLRPCLVPTKIQKLFKILRHIESCGTCMKH